MNKYIISNDGYSFDGKYDFKQFIINNDFSLTYVLDSVNVKVLNLDEVANTDSCSNTNLLILDKNDFIVSYELFTSETGELYEKYYFENSFDDSSLSKVKENILLQTNNKNISFSKNINELLLTEVHETIRTNYPNLTFYFETSTIIDSNQVLDDTPDFPIINQEIPF